MLLYTYNLYVHSQFDKIHSQIHTSVCIVNVHTHTYTLVKHTGKNLISNNTIFLNMIQLPVHMGHHTTFISFNIIGYIYNRHTNLVVLSVIQQLSYTA
jgi:hypothetical protein